MIEEAHASTGLLASLGINGWQFAAQLVNFSIVLFVMWKWVYIPLLALMEKRSKEIEDGLKNATLAERRLQDATEEKDRLMKQARVESHAILEEATAKAETLRQEKLALAKAEIEKYVTDAKQQMKSERDASAASLKREVASLVVLATKQIAVSLTDEQKTALTAKALEDVK